MVTDYATAIKVEFCTINNTISTSAMTNWQVRAACIYRSTHTYTHVYTY